MLNAKFHLNRFTGYGEEDYRRIFAIYWHGGHLGHAT